MLKCLSGIGDMVQAIEYLPDKHKGLSSNPSTGKKIAETDWKIQVK
jgi:hypothetical protein